MSVLTIEYAKNNSIKLWRNKTNSYCYRNHDLPAMVTEIGFEWYGFNRINSLPALLEFKGDKSWFRFKNKKYIDSCLKILYNNGELRVFS